MTDLTTTSFLKGDDERLTTKLRAAHAAPLPADTPGGQRDPRTRFLLNDLYHRALSAGLCLHREQFLELVGRTIGRIFPERDITSQPALTLSNQLLVERVLFPQTLFDRLLPEKIALYNQALDLLFNEESSEEIRQFANAVTHVLYPSFHPYNGICSCGHPLHLRLDCPLHGGSHS